MIKFPYKWEDLPSCGCSLMTSRLQCGMLENTSEFSEDADKNDKNLLGQYFQPLLFIKRLNSDEPSHECRVPILTS